MGARGEARCDVGAPLATARDAVCDPLDGAARGAGGEARCDFGAPPILPRHNAISDEWQRDAYGTRGG